LVTYALLLYSGVLCADTGNELLQKCRDEGPTGATFCLGYIVGYGYGYADGRQGGAIYQRFGNMKPEDFDRRKSEVNKISRAASEYCIPDGVTQGQVRDIVVRYLDQNPTIRHGPAQILITMALKESFPCK
jgi:hypothetical protein